MFKSKNILKHVFILLVLFTVLIFYCIKIQKDSRYRLLESFREKKNLSLISFLNDQKVNILRTNLPWYMEGGVIYPSPNTSEKLPVWPDGFSGDRILNQLMYTPNSSPRKIKKIYIVDDLESFFVTIGRSAFLNGSQHHFFGCKKCPVDECEIVSKKENADAVIYRNYIKYARNFSVPSSQIWILYVMENPFHSGASRDVNWTASYRHDSDIVVPYEKWLYYNENVKFQPQAKNYASGKSKKVAWFVSNCNPKNNRMEYALELKKYIEVDIFGSCGEHECPINEECLDILTSEYKFYLAFENGNCRDYITEKFYNALKHTVLPIVMGAHPDDYEKVAPYNSYIHVENFKSPFELAKYLYYLDENDDLYNSYFEWRGTGEFISTYFFCRVCALLHSEEPSKSYKDFMFWWNGPNVCKKGSWLK